MQKADAYVEVTIHVRDQPQLGWLGVTDQPEQARKLFGLCTFDGYLTHMNYGTDHTDPAEMVRHAMTKGDGVFHFDAGTNGRPITISHLELAHGLRKLGLI